MVDEAHRTQYGRLAAKMRAALPNATFVGFTGTPIDRGFRRSTLGVFGELIDSYTIPQSVEDGATVPIHYEARLPELHVEGPETLDRLFDALFGDEPEGDKGGNPPALREQGAHRGGREAHRGDRARHLRALRGEDPAERIQGAGGRGEPRGGPALCRAPRHLRAPRLPGHHDHQQRRPGVPGGSGPQRGRDRRGVHRPRWGAADPRSRRQADHRLRCASRAGPLPRPLDPRAHAAAGDCAGEPPVLPHGGRRHDREDLRPHRRLQRRLGGAGGRPRDLRPRRRRGRAARAARGSRPCAPRRGRPGGVPLPRARPRRRLGLRPPLRGGPGHRGRL